MVQIMKVENPYSNSVEKDSIPFSTVSKYRFSIIILIIYMKDVSNNKLKDVNTLFWRILFHQSNFLDNQVNTAKEIEGHRCPEVPWYPSELEQERAW